MNTLAERIKELKQDAANTKGSDAGWQAVNEKEAGEIVFPHLDEILTALQFANDMQTIAVREPKFNRTATGFECWINMPKSGLKDWRQAFTGDTYFAAARAACEAIQK